MDASLKEEEEEAGGRREEGREEAGRRRRKQKCPKSMGGREKVSKYITKTNGFLTSLLITLQVWTPEATISLYFAYETTHPTQGGVTDTGQTDRHTHARTGGGRERAAGARAGGD